MNKNDNNEMLSFDELRKQLGMDTEEPPKKQNISTSKTNVAKKEEPKISSTPKEPILDEKEIFNQVTPKRVTDYNNSFVDITDQYVKKETKEEPQPPQTVQEPQKKKVRTFNEIFSDFFGNFLPLKKDSNKEKIRKVVMDVSIVVIICCVIAFGELYRQYRVQLKSEDDIKDKIVSTDELDNNQYNDAWQEILAKYPDIKMPEGMNLKYAYLYAINQDLVGWLKINNTNLDVQVVQSKDNGFYLRRDFYGKKSRYGCPYMDFNNNHKDLDDNTIIYGHHMPDGLMFSQLDKYKTLEGYKDSPIIQYDTIYETYYFKVFAAFVTNADAADDNGYFFNFMLTDFPTDDTFRSFIDNVNQRSIFSTDVSVEPDDKLITLMTCSYEFKNARLVVMGRMVREDEDLTVDTSNATLNTSPRYPQAWYDAKGTENPYKDAENWTP